MILHSLHVKYRLFLSYFSQTRIFPADYYENLEMSIYVKIHLVWAELLHADRQKQKQTDRHDEATSHFL